jgi:hypothetical protein
VPYTGVQTGGAGFNAYAAGAKSYGSGRPMPTIGRVDPTGYAERDRMSKARRNAILQRMKAGLSGQFASANYNRSVR